MKLFLASSLDKTISLLLEKAPAKGRVIFISNASDPYEGDKWWVEADRKAFADNGFELIELDLRTASKDDFVKQLKNADILHFCGGSVLYLISLIKEKNLENIIKDAVLKDGLIYTGTSAGSMIAADSVNACIYDPDEEEFINKNNFSDFSGLGLVNFLVMPHCSNQDFVDSNVGVAKHLPELQTPLIMIYDNQAVWVEEGKVEILALPSYAQG